MNLSPRNKLILTAVAVLAAVVVLVVAVLMPQYRRYRDLSQKVADSDKRIAAAQALLQVRQESKARSAFTSAEMLELLSGMPENPDLPSLIIELQDIAYRCNVQMRSLEPEELIPSELGDYQIAPSSITVWGSWVDTVDFMQYLPTMSRQIRIVAVSSTPLTEQSIKEATEPLDDGALSTRIEIEAYTIPAGAEAQGQDLPAEPESGQ